jgi:hypothetical protein
MDDGGGVFNRAGGIRTHTGLRPEDFKSPASTIPPPPLAAAVHERAAHLAARQFTVFNSRNVEATAGFEPAIRVLQTLALPLGDVAL